MLAEILVFGARRGYSASNPYDLVLTLSSAIKYRLEPSDIAAA